ncbi:MAG: serine/threonine-protein phosphatase [Clostridiales bacterium]|nr:serine/threonine-protein phosphatase [Clostridiales bacterium]
MLKPLKLISEEAIRFSGENTLPVTKLREQVSNKDEVGALAGSIDIMEAQVHDYIENITKITAEKQRISTELSLATRIQADMLPNIYPAFPERFEFDIYASMDPAKEVGGDFYDFFLVDDDHLCIVMADVSGKGVPAALFMMASKIILANNAMIGKSPVQILTDTNAAICSNNREEMFVTVWLGIFEISTGKLTAANAGHEFPALMQPDGSFELFKDKHGFVIGGMDGMRYKEYEIILKPGAKLFLYTDGVPEATSAENELFGTERMLAALNGERSAAPDKLLKNVRASVDAFVKEAEQFDDLTMLCLEYKGTDEIEFEQKNK